MISLAIKCTKNTCTISENVLNQEGTDTNFKDLADKLATGFLSQTVEKVLKIVETEVRL